MLQSEDPRYGKVCRGGPFPSILTYVLQEITYFSYDDEHRFHLDERSICYYYPPRLGVDLTRGFDTFEKLDDTADDHLDSLLKTIAALEEENGKKVEAHVITWRGMMTKVRYMVKTDQP